MYPTIGAIMIITCEKCNTGYELDSAAIGVGGRTVKCSDCGHIWRQFPPKDESLERDAGEAVFSKSTFRGSSLPMKAKQAAAPATGIFPKFLFLVLLILNLPVGLLAFGDNMLLSYPRLEKKIRVYSSRGVQFHDVKYHRELADDKATLLVNGEIVNSSDEIRKMPEVMISFIDKDGKKLLSRKYPLEIKYLNPGQAIPFAPKISDIPESKVSAIYLDMGNSLEVLFR
jgi:predicted Zn finger-like uncharacterized protein